MADVHFPVIGVAQETFLHKVVLIIQTVVGHPCPGTIAGYEHAVIQTTVHQSAMLIANRAVQTQLITGTEQGVYICPAQQTAAPGGLCPLVVQSHIPAGTLPGPCINHHRRGAALSARLQGNTGFHARNFIKQQG